MAYEHIPYPPSVAAMAVANQKGGVGKTTTAVNTAFQLVEEGKRVLVCDCDRQGNASSTLKNYYGEDIVVGQAVQLYLEDEIDFEPPPPLDDELGAGEIALFEGTKPLAAVGQMSNSVVLNPRRHLIKIIEQWKPDVILFDTPPDLNLQQYGALLASQKVLVPLELGSYSLDGLQELLGTIQNVRNRFTPDLTILGVLPNMIDPRADEEKDNLKALVSALGNMVLPAGLRRLTPIKGAINASKPVWVQARTGSQRTAAKEVKRSVTMISNKLLPEGEDNG